MSSELSNPERPHPTQQVSNADYIRIYLGLMGSGKTTRALHDVQSSPRVIVYSPGSTNPLLFSYPRIYDTPNYTKDLFKFLQIHPKIWIEKRHSPTDLFSKLAQVKGYTIVFDDVATLKTDAAERRDFEAMVRTVRFNGNRLILTTHRFRKDIPPLVQVIGTSLYYVGPGALSKKEIDTLYDVVNFQISYDEFENRLKNNPKHNLFQIKGA